MNRRSAMPALYSGLLLTMLATGAPFVDAATTHLLADHVRAGYPAYSDSRIDEAVTTYLVCLSVVGVLGILCWLATIWAVRSGRRWAPAAGVGALVAGTAIALAGLLIKDTSGDTGLPATLGWIGMLPCIAGLVAVIRLWQGRTVASNRA